MATGFVLLLSTEHISEALKVVEKFTSSDSGFGTWFAAAGLQIFEVLTGMGVADLIAKKKRSGIVLSMLIMILIVFFLINVSGNILYAFSNMVQVNGRELTMDMITDLDDLKKFWVFWAAIPIPLMGVAGISVQAIFKLDLDKKEIKIKKETKSKGVFVNETMVGDALERAKKVDQSDLTIPLLDRMQALANEVLEKEEKPARKQTQKPEESKFWDDGVNALKEVENKKEVAEKKK